MSGEPFLWVDVEEWFAGTEPNHCIFAPEHVDANHPRKPLYVGGEFTRGYEAGMGACLPRLNALLEENSELKRRLLNQKLAKGKM